LSRPSQTLNLAIQAQPLVQYGYTPNSKLASLTDGKAPSGNVTTFAYDGLDRLVTTTYPNSSTEKVLSYDADGNVLTRQTRAGATIGYSYDTLNRLSTKTPPSPAPVVTYTFDLAGHPTGVSDNSAAVTAPSTAASYATATTYDALNRPLGVSWTPAPTQATPSASSVTFTHGYDGTNRRTQQAVSDNTWLLYPAATGSTTAYTANALNQYSAVGSVTPTYDGNGNLTFDGTFTYAYDAENRLISITQGGTTIASYAHDGRGRRKSKTVGSTTTLYVTDADGREVLEYAGTGGAVGTWYAYGLGLNAVLNQMNVAAGTRETMIPDIQGSILATLDSGSGALSKAGYLTYGENPGSLTGTFRFTGQRFDPETGGTTNEPSGLYYYRARMYSPTLGRFMQPDPVGYQSGVNLYAYVGNDPLNGTDPPGLWTLELGLSINILLGSITLQGSSGFAIDNHGNVASLNVGGIGGGAGGRFSGGISVGASNAENVGQLSSWFNNVSVGVAAGPSASVEAFQGTAATGTTVVGGAFTAGVGLGGGSVTQTYTVVTPLNYSLMSPAPNSMLPQSSTPSAMVPPLLESASPTLAVPLGVSPSPVAQTPSMK